MPDWRAEIRSRLAALALPPEREMEIVEEIGQHLEDRHARSRSLGLSEEEASARAWRELDESDVLGRALARVESPAPAYPPLGTARQGDRRASSLWLALSMFPRDLVHATRTLAKARAYSFVCIASLGVGMGTVMAILVLIRAAFGTPPGINPDGLVELVVEPTGQLRADARGPILDTWSYPDFVDVRDGASGLSTAGWAFGESLLRLPGGSAATPVATMYVSSNYFTTVGVNLASGRGFEPAHDVIGAPPVVVLGQRLWETTFGSNPAIVGSTITLNQTPHVVVGIAPRRYRWHFNRDGVSNPELWIPLVLHPRIQEGLSAQAEGAKAAGDVRFNRRLDWVYILGRLDPGTDVRQADAAVASIMSGLASRYPDSNQFKRGAVKPYFSVGARRNPEIRVIRGMFLGAAGLVLLIVCLNVSGMMVVRSALRERELAIRLSIGASRGRLIQYLLAEAAVLSVLGGAFSALLLFGAPIAVAWWFEFWDSNLDPLLPNVWTAVQVVGLCVITSLVFGLLPAVRFSRPALVSVLKDESGGGRRVGLFHRLTAAVQAGIAVPFLVAGGVRLDQARVTTQADLGFRPDGLFAAPLKSASITSDDDRTEFLRRLQQRLAQAPGTSWVTFGDGLPLDFDSRLARVFPEDDATPALSRITRVAPAYLETLGIRLLRGRDFAPADGPGAERVVMLSEPLAARLFPARDPLGARVTIAVGDNAGGVFTIVGITSDLVGSQMGNPRPQLFVPLAQNPAPSLLAVVRSSVPEPEMRKTFEAAVRDLDADYVLSDVITGDQLRRDSRSDLLVQSVMSAGAASVALVLAALGVYGVIGFMVAMRTREIGVRVALGASRWRVVRDVLGDSLRLVVPGVALGLLLAMFWVRRIDSSWYPLGGVEPLIYALAAATAFAVAFLASASSARRAAAVQPLEAMRSE
jgi:putative ABC transport system permease protein